MPAPTNPLAALPKLPKPHHSWPMGNNLLADDTYLAVLTHYARITGSFPLEQLTYATKVGVAKAAAVAKAANASLDIVYSPWSEDDSPFPRKAPPTYVGPEEAAELALYRKKLSTVKAWLGSAVGRGVTILLDQERWDARGANATVLAAITRKNNLFYNASLSIFPKAGIELYARGDVGRAANPTGWEATPYYTLAPEERGAFASSLYTISEIGYTRASFNRTANNARAHGVSSVTPWIALGQGYVRSFDGQDASWSADPKYHPFIYSWEFGMEINNPWYGQRPTRFADWGMAKAVMIYPDVFGSTPAIANSSWQSAFNHFVMYVRGAAGVRDLTPVA